jgi:hypothetical protein
MNITSTEDQGTYANYVNPVWVKLLDALRGCIPPKFSGSMRSILDGKQFPSNAGAF